MSQGIEETQFWAQISAQEPVAEAILEQLCQEKDYPTLVYLMKINPQFKKLCSCFDHFKVKQRPKGESNLNYTNSDELAKQLRSGVSPNQLNEDGKTNLYTCVHRYIYGDGYSSHPEIERNLIKTMVKYGGIAHPKLSPFERIVLHHILSHDVDSQNGIDIIKKYYFDQDIPMKWEKFWHQMSDSVKLRIIESNTLGQVVSVLNENNLLWLLSSKKVVNKKIRCEKLQPRLGGFDIFLRSNRGKYAPCILDNMWSRMSNAERQPWKEEARRHWEEEKKRRMHEFNST
jgi:hypothetical protein